MLVNGEKIPLNSPATVDDLLRTKGFDKEKVAVAQNGIVVARETYAETYLGDDDVIEIFTFMGGG